MASQNKPPSVPVPASRNASTVYLRRLALPGSWQLALKPPISLQVRHCQAARLSKSLVCLRLPRMPQKPDNAGCVSAVHECGSQSKQARDRVLWTRSPEMKGLGRWGIRWGILQVRCRQLELIAGGPSWLAGLLTEQTAWTRGFNIQNHKAGLPEAPTANPSPRISGLVLAQVECLPSTLALLRSKIVAFHRV